MIKEVLLWNGMGYTLTAFAVPEPCESAEYALEQVTTQIVNENQTDFFEEADSDYINEPFNEPWNDRENGDHEGWLYVDATMEGANRPVYIRTENLSFR